MRTLCLLLLSITTSRSFMPKTLPRRSAIAALTSVPFLAAPPATAFPKDPLTRLVESTKAKRLRDGAREHFEEEEEGVIEDVLADGATGGVAGGTPAAATLSTPAGLAKVDAELNAMFENHMVEVRAVSKSKFAPGAAVERDAAFCLLAPLHLPRLIALLSSVCCVFSCRYCA